MPPKSSDTAYIIFTSGSTGEPKGVEITHEQVLNTLYSVQDKCNLSCKDIVMNVSQFDFDLSVFDIFSPLIQGATMCYVNEDYWRDGNKWLEIIQNILLQFGILYLHFFKCYWKIWSIIK